MSTTHIPVALRELIARQAGHRCGYCRTAEEVIGTPLEIDHRGLDVQHYSDRVGYICLK